MIDRELNALLWRWGTARKSDSLNIKPPPLFKMYVAPGFPEGLNPKFDSEEVEALALIIDKHLDRMQTEALKCRYRYKHEGHGLNKRLSAEHLSVSKTEYMQIFDSAIQLIELRMEKAA